MTTTTSTADQGGAAALPAAPSPGTEAAAPSEAQQAWAAFDAAEKPAATVDNTGDGKSATETKTDTKNPETQPSAATAAPAKDTKADTSPEGGQKNSGPDPWTNATPEQKAALEELNKQLTAAKTLTATLEHENRSNRGRLRRLQQPAGKPADAGTETPTAGKNDATAKPAGFFATDEWKTFTTEYPDVAKAMKAAFDANAATVDEVKGELKSLTEDRDAEFLSSQHGYVLNQHPDYATIAGTAAFKTWLTKQPQYVRDGVDRNGDVIIDGEEVSDIVTKFKRETGTSVSQGNDQGNGQQPAAGTKPGGSSQQQPARDATPGENRREAQLESAASPRTKGTSAVTTGIPNDAKGAWDHFERLGL